MVAELRKRARSATSASEQPVAGKIAKVVKQVEPGKEPENVTKKVAKKTTKVEPGKEAKTVAKKTTNVEKIQKVEPDKEAKKVTKKTTNVEKIQKVEPGKEAKTVTKKTTNVEKLHKVPKRKASEEAQTSPVATKKQKPVRASLTSKRSKPEPVEEVEPGPETDITELSHEHFISLDNASDLDEAVDADIQALATGLDPDADKAPADNATFKEGMDVGEIPQQATKHKGSAYGRKEEPGVVFISRLPHGFYEHELRGYFSQFGPINRLRLARNRKTAASKHYAFIEFAEESTAEIVAKAMDSYLLFGHILKVKTVPRDRLHEQVWKGANRRFKKVPWSKIAAGNIAKPRTESAWSNKVSREEKKRQARAQKLKEMGYEFEAPELKKAVAPAAAPVTFDTSEEPKAIEAAPVEEKAAEGKPEEEENPVADKLVEKPTGEEATETKTSKVSKTKAKKGGQRKSRA